MSAVARQWRIKFEGAYYRILPRGNERRNIFNNNQEIGNLFGLGYTSLSLQVTIMKSKMSGEDEMNKRLEKQTPNQGATPLFPSREMWWGATGGEKLIRRLTNSIRLVVTASLLANGEAQTFEKRRKPINLRGSVGKQW